MINQEIEPATDEFSRVLRTRRTVAAFQPTMPPTETVLQGIEVARWAPNHKMTQPWRFHLLGTETKQQIIELNTRIVTADKGEKAAEKKRTRWSSIPGWIVVTCQTSPDELRDRENYAAVCCAVQNLMLFLWSREIGTKWSTSGVIRDPEFYRVLKLDTDSEQVAGLLWYGYPAQMPTSKRLPVSEITIVHP